MRFFALALALLATALHGVPDTWTMQDVHSFVSSVGSSPRWKKMADILLDNEVDGPLMQEINQGDLEDLGITSFYARRLLKAAAEEVAQNNGSQRRALAEGDTGTMQNQCLVTSMLDLQAALEETNGEIVALNKWRGTADEMMAENAERITILEGINPTRPPLEMSGDDSLGWVWDAQNNCEGTEIVASGITIKRKQESHLKAHQNGEIATITHIGVASLGKRPMPPYTGKYSWILEVGPPHWMTLGISPVLPSCAGNTYCPNGATTFSTDSTTNCYNGKWTATNAADISLPESCFGGVNTGDRVLFTLDTTEHLFSIKALDSTPVGGETFSTKLHCTVEVGASTYYPYVHLYNPVNYVTIVCEGEECGDAFLPYDKVMASPTSEPTEPAPCLHDWCWDTESMCGKMEVVGDGLKAQWKGTENQEGRQTHIGVALIGTEGFKPSTGNYTWRIKVGPKHWMVIGVMPEPPACKGNNYCQAGATGFSTDTTTICVNGKWLGTNALPEEYKGACQAGLELGDSALITLDTDNHTLTVKGEKGDTVEHEKDIIDCTFHIGSATYYPYVHLYNSQDYAIVTCQGENC